MEHNRKESLWIHCPICGGKTRTKVYEDTLKELRKYLMKEGFEWQDK